MANLKTQITKIAETAKAASRGLSLLSRYQKDKALFAMSDSLIKDKELILKANQKDVSYAKKAGLSPALIDRLTLNDSRIKAMADSLKSLAELKDPVFEVLETRQMKNGLIIRKIAVPIGVIAIIYESRPNVTSDCIGLCLKSGNCVILRGGKEAINSNTAIFKALNRAALQSDIPKGAISLITAKDRSSVRVIVEMVGLVDLVMPRGGEALINEIIKYARVPVIKHYKGVCHVYVDRAADLKKAEEICFNAKVSRPGVCNAMETMLVHKDVAKKFLPLMTERLERAGVKILGLKSVKGINWSTEYLDLILAVKIVNSLQEAIEHINKYGSMHSDSIVTENRASAKAFLEAVDSSCVYVNASTRFTDGGEFGMGAEIGISTEKLHARGPMSLKELTTYKYHIIGSGQVRK